MTTERTIRVTIPDGSTRDMILADAGEGLRTLSHPDFPRLQIVAAPHETDAEIAQEARRYLAFVAAREQAP